MPASPAQREAGSRAVRGPDPMPFWKSAPYLAHFMHGYRPSSRCCASSPPGPRPSATSRRVGASREDIDRERERVLARKL